MNKKEVLNQYCHVLQLIKDCKELEDFKRVLEENNQLEIEVNYNPLKEYQGEDIEVIRIEYKNIMIYLNPNDNDFIPDYIIIFNEHGEEIGEGYINIKFYN